MKYLIVGLGNVGDEYAHTRHNIGFDVVYAFVTKHGGTFNVERHAFLAEIKWKGKTFVCICPTTYMNLSGKAVKFWMEKEKIEKEQLLVVVDDLALPIDRIRVKPSGSDAGHNGLKSIQESIGTPDYPKLRFGIGNDYQKGRQADFVLSKWKKSEELLVQKKIEAAVNAIETFATQGIATVMNQFNNQEYQS
jgi:PTH1 family peptidyl-tRNA hydrolase